MFIRLGLVIKAESKEDAVEIILDLEDKGIFTDTNVWTDDDGWSELDVVTYDQKIEFTPQYTTKPNVPSNLSREKNLIISDTIIIEDSKEGTDDLDSVKLSVNNLCRLRDDIVDNTDYNVEEIIQKLAR